MKFLFFAFSVLSAFFGMCFCMDGFFNSSEFEAVNEEFGLEVFTSVGVENFEDNYSIEEMPIFFLNPDLSLIVGKDEGPRPVSREAARKINYVCL